MVTSRSKRFQMIDDSNRQDVRDIVYVADGDLGKGLFANRLIRAGEIIFVFAGPVIGFPEAVAKGDRECYPLQISKDKYIDLAEPGCYANHSCDPNAGVRDGANGQSVRLVAIKDIPPGTEIRYDYSTTMDEDYFTMACRCGSPKCRGRVTDFKLLDSEVQERYLALGVVMSFIARQYAKKMNVAVSPLQLGQLAPLQVRNH
jgi:uncharacterized protein